jgi:hypothetical protein
MIELESMAVEMPEVAGHPNRAGFRGVLTVVDVASQRAPAGSKGHRVVLTRAAAEAALPSLLGMALDYAPSFDRHDVRRKVGVITSAEIVGRDLEVGGYLYAKDFPDVVEEIGKWGESANLRDTSSIKPHFSRRERARNGAPAGLTANEGTRLRAALAAAAERILGLASAMRASATFAPALRAESARNGRGLGMSFEVSDVVLADMRARVWILTRVTFTGAAILRRDKAAYEDTWIELY